MKWGGQDLPIAALLMNNKPADGRRPGRRLRRRFGEQRDRTRPRQFRIRSSSAPRPRRRLQGGRAGAQQRPCQLQRLSPGDGARAGRELRGRSSARPRIRRRRRAGPRSPPGFKALYGNVDNLEYYVGLFAEPRAENGPLPSLISVMVAMDAFSQAFTNPLLSEHVWGDETNRKAAFTEAGIDRDREDRRAARHARAQRDRSRRPLRRHDPAGLETPITRWPA